MQAPVSAVMPVQDPDQDDLELTLDSLARQVVMPSELVVVDSSPGAPVELPALPFRAWVDHHPEWADAGRTTPRQRRVGQEQTTEPVVWRLDEDAVFERDDTLAVLLEDLDRPNVVAACCRAEPLHPSISGRFSATMIRAEPRYGLFPLYRRADCPSAQCFPFDTTAWYSPRAEDVVFANELMKKGLIHRNDGLVAYTNLPMTRTKWLMRGAGLAAAYVALGGVS